MGELVLTVTDRDGRARELCGRGGERLMPVLRDQVDVTIGTCGGQLSCGTCLVLLDAASAAHLAPPGEDELEMLDALGAEPGARLACQLTLPDSAARLAVTIAPEA
ncbi:2Fe-2S iron-sulfur cluster-binding protein [Phenylobacterium sp. LjRoot219]|uniref:2Fe-2S iron-sulfur cluster-binding protein n=1 Tax=Phenylobacterium sp. LjRoot219 TaxID=3342283 RepID=UPI003ED05F48